jgi:oxygen-dependent protoporphyrinogen oxidase
MSSRQKTIAIIGGGITGLAAAFRAQTVLPDARVVLLESSDRVGGVLQTESVDGYLIEQSADMFTTDPPAAIELCQQLGKTNELIQTQPTPDRAYVATDDSIHPVPRGLSLMLPNDLGAVMNSPLLDPSARQRFAAERDVPVGSWANDESLESFAIRRFGKTAFDHLIQPLVAGIYTADPKRLSMKATMARFVEMEKQYGSLIRAAEATRKQPNESQASGARYGMFRAPQHGIGQLVSWLQDALTDVDMRTDCPVKSIEKSNASWLIDTLPAGSQAETVSVDGVVMAIPAQVSGQLLKSVDTRLEQSLSKIEAASSAIVVMGIDRSQIEKDFHGYGIIVPSVLNRQVIATSFSSNKFGGRAPKGKLLIRSFIGGALQRELVDLDDQQLVNLATQELKKTVGFHGNPELTRVFRWRKCMPQYHLGHLDLVAEIERLVGQHTGLEIAGNSYRGVGIPACIESGSGAIERLAKDFANG